MKKHPFVIWSSVICVALCISTISLAEGEAKDSAKAEVGQELYKKALGYWVMDFDAAETKAFVAEKVKQGAPADIPPVDIQKEMETLTFEFKPGQMVIHEKNDSDFIKITVKSQDIEKGVLVADFDADGDESKLITLRINGNLLVLTVKESEDKDVSFGLKRIDEATFKKRVPEGIEKQAPDPDPEPQAVEIKDGYPVATAVPNKAGFVFSPYNQQLIDVTSIPSGTLVMDPHYPSDEKKFFRVP